MGRSTRLNILDREQAVVVLILLSLRDPINPIHMHHRVIDAERGLFALDVDDPNRAEFPRPLFNIAPLMVLNL